MNKNCKLCSKEFESKWYKKNIASMYSNWFFFFGWGAANNVCDECFTELKRKLK